MFDRGGLNRTTFSERGQVRREVGVGFKITSECAAHLLQPPWGGHRGPSRICVTDDQPVLGSLSRGGEARYASTWVDVNVGERAIYCLPRWTHDRPIRPPKNQRGGL